MSEPNADSGLIYGSNFSDTNGRIYAGFDNKLTNSSTNIPKLKLVVVLIYSFLSLAIFLNIRVICMVIRILCCRPVSSRPDGNRHVFVYILSLSIVDSLVLAHLPLVATDIMLSRWIFGDAMCKLYWLIEQVNRILSTFMLTALSADRYLAVCTPIRSTFLRNTLTALGIITVCVLVATSLLTPTVVFSHVVEWDVHNQTILKCMFAMDATMLARFLIYIFVCGYCVPLLCMVYFYANILRALWRNHSPNHTSTTGRMEHRNGSSSFPTRSHNRRRQTAQHVTKKALGLVSFYFACWTPYWIVQFYIHLMLAENEMEAEDGVIIALYAVHVLVYVNSAVNPFLYALLNKELQKQHSLSVKSRQKTTSTADQQHQRELLISSRKERATKLPVAETHRNGTRRQSDMTNTIMRNGETSTKDGEGPLKN